jgi:hypothetical protein
MPNYVNRVGETIGDLEIQTILRYENSEPVYGCRCICGAAGVGIKHDAFRKGTARCTSSLHGRPELKPTPTAAVSVGSRGNGWAEFYHEQLNQPQPEPALQPDVEGERRKAEKAAQQERYLAKLRSDWQQYRRFGYAHGWNLSKMISLENWYKIADYFRDQIMERMSSGYYEQEMKDK